MGIEESNITARVLKRVSRLGTRLFRVNTGLAWAGKVIKLRAGQVYKASDGDIVIKGAYPIRMGLITGGSDLIGWHPITISAEMVGCRAALFAAPEVKTDTGRPTKEQITFIRNVREAGGIAGIVKSEDEAVDLILEWPKRDGK